MYIKQYHKVVGAISEGLPFLNTIYLYKYLCYIVIEVIRLKDERTKTIKLDLNNPEEKSLWEWLKKLAHGEFTERTKEYWMKEKIKEEKI